MKLGSLTAACAGLFLSSSLFSHTVAARLAFLAMAALCCAAALVRDRRSLSLLPPIWLPFLLWVGWCAVSLLWSQEPERSIKEFRNEIGYGSLALWTCYIAGQTRQSMPIIVPMVSAAVLALCGVSYFYFSLGEERYALGWHGGPGNLSSAVLTILPLALMAAWYGRQTGARAVFTCSAALVALLLIAAYTTQNRTVWLAFSGQLLLIWALLAARAKVIRGASAIKPGASILALAIAAAIALILFLVHAQRRTIGEPDLSGDPRLSIWPEVLALIAENPVTGYGFGRGIVRHTLVDGFKNHLVWHGHNVFLDMALQVGIPGAALLLLLLAATVYCGWRMTRLQDNYAAACGIALIAVVAGMVGRNFTDMLFVRQNALLYWGVVGMLLAWGSSSERRPAAPSG